MKLVVSSSVPVPFETMEHTHSQQTYIHHLVGEWGCGELGLVVINNNKKISRAPIYRTRWGAQGAL